MTKKHLSIELLILLLATDCTEPSLAQSGRGRQLRTAERLPKQTSFCPAIGEDSQNPATVIRNSVSISKKPPGIQL